MPLQQAAWFYLPVFEDRLLRLRKTYRSHAQIFDIRDSVRAVTPVKPAATVKAVAATEAEDVLRNVDFINERERIAFEEARFGHTVQDWLVGPIGRFLHGRAKITVEQCKDKMLELNPNDDDFEEHFRNLKDEAWAAEHTLLWLSDALQNGLVAEHQIDEDEFNE